MTFTITQVGVLLGKSAATLRSWERRGEFAYPRKGTDRALSPECVQDLAAFAYFAGRISQRRHRLVHAMMLLQEQLIEEEME